MGAGPIPQSDALTGVVAALPAEARSARRLKRSGWLVTAGGVGVEGAQAAAQALLEAGAERLLVWGTAGALQPGVGTGALIVAGEVLDTDGGRYPVDGDWQARLAAAAPAGVTVCTGALITAARPVPDSRAKTALAQRSGAVAVDLETAAVARLAFEHGVPFAVVRAIVDPLAQALPQAVLRADPGRHVPFAVAMRLALRPHDLPPVVALARNMRIAKDSLSATARRLAEAESS